MSLTALADGISKPIGIALEGDEFEIIIPEGTRYPTTEPVFREFKIAFDNQAHLGIPIYQGLEALASNNELQGVISVDIPIGCRQPKGTTIQIGFGLDNDGILTAGVGEKGPLSGLVRCAITRPWESFPSSHQGRCLQCGTLVTFCSCCGAELPRQGVQ